MSDTPLDQTIKGGAYQNADGSWVDANGKPIPAPKTQVVKPPANPAPEVAKEVTSNDSASTETESALADSAPKRGRAKKSQ